MSTLTCGLLPKLQRITCPVPPGLTMARKLVVDDGADDEMLAATIHGTKDVLQAADGHHVRSGAWWHGRAKVMAMTKKNAKGRKLRQQMFKRINEDGEALPPKDLASSLAVAQRNEQRAGGGDWCVCMGGWV